MASRFQVSWKTLLIPVVGLVAFFLYLYLFGVDLPTIIATAQNIDLYIYSIAVAALLLETFIFSLSWRSLLSFLEVRLSAMKALLFVWFGIFMDIIIPAESISGEIARAYLVTREQSGTSGQVAASLVAHRLMGMGINVSSLLIGMLALLSERQLAGIVLNLSLFLVLATTLVLTLLLLLSVRESWTLRIVNTLIRLAERLMGGRWDFTGIKEKAASSLKMFHGSIKAYRSAPGTLLLSLSLYIISWLLHLAVASLVFLSIGYPVPWTVIVVTTAIVMAVKAIPLGVPFEAGLPEITMSTIYIFFGVPPNISATSTILFRILTVWLRFFVGFAVQEWIGIKSIRDIGIGDRHNLTESSGDTANK